MSRCVQCGTESSSYPEDYLCAYHAALDSEWATRNRAFCDFVHRGVEPPSTAALGLVLSVDGVEYVPRPVVWQHQDYYD